MVVKENLPFTHVESEFFLNVVKLLNPEALELFVKGDAICGHVMKLYFQIRSQVQIVMDKFFESLNCTCDVWTSPTNDPIFPLTGHWISKKDSQLKVRLIHYLSSEKSNE